MRGARRIGVGLAVCALAGSAGAAPARAGRLIVTGHDVDLHCSGSADPARQSCHYMKVAVDYVRAGSAKPVLVLDKGAGEVSAALDRAYGAGVVPRQVVDPATPAFAGLALSPSSFSAIIVASDAGCGGCDLNLGGTTADSDAINARTADVATFFNGGGGVLALTGATHADGDPGDGPDVFYNFVPIPVGGVAVSPPFSLTDDGRALGLLDPPADPGRATSTAAPPTTRSRFRRQGAR